LKKAQNDAASLTAEYVAANMAPEEAQRLERVRNIGIAVRHPLLLLMAHAKGKQKLRWWKSRHTLTVVKLR
jgi:hypothetical protein